MGMTLTDIYRKMYYDYRRKGLTHEESINKFPERLRGFVQESIDMTYCESHYGFKCNELIKILAILIGVPVLTLILCFFQK